MSGNLGEKSLAVLRIAAEPVMSARRAELYKQAADRWSDKAVQTKFDDLAGRGLIEYGVSARTGWLTPEGKAALERASAPKPNERKD